MVSLHARKRRGALAVALLGLLAGCGEKRGVVARGFDPDTVPDAFLRPVGALMWPGATRAFQVTPAGDLTTGAWALRVRPWGDTLAAAAPRRIAAEERWRPVLHWSRASGPVRWDFEAVACPAPAPGFFAPRGALAAWLARRVENLERRQLDATLASMPESRMDRLL